ATILGKDEIIMNLVPITSELEEPIEYRQLGSDGGEIGLPIVRVREMSTTVKVKNGEMLVIGGLISDVQDNKGEFAPILGDIPLLRYLFGYEEKEHLKRELIILLRPRII
ncbi:MAG: type II and III secretion system protein, partial [Deltaproteobacteria bacterium]|nr:type II and III secretion system protein [Deltaproteobacteria bacterium]